MLCQPYKLWEVYINSIYVLDSLRTISYVKGIFSVVYTSRNGTKQLWLVKEA